MRSRAVSRFARKRGPAAEFEEEDQSPPVSESVISDFSRMPPQVFFVSSQFEKKIFYHRGQQGFHQGKITSRYLLANLARAGYTAGSAVSSFSALALPPFSPERWAVA